VSATASFTLTVTNPNCTATYDAATDVSVGNRPTSIAIGDFNGDGMQDFATANYWGNNVSIRLGDGTGGFTSASDVTVGNSPYLIAIGDFNGDGMQDFATANEYEATVSIGLGTGTGGFTSVSDVSIGWRPRSITIGDFNGDGMQDFATVNGNGANVSIRLGDGTGGFTSPSNVTVGNNPYSIAIGDFNGDGMQDFATANNNDDDVSIRLGDGTGGFTSASDVSVGDDPRSIAIGDFNGDGMQDFATANFNGATVSIRLGDGTGVFTSTSDVSVGDDPRSIAIGDFNGDGMQDFATANYSDYNVSIRLGEAVSITGATEVYVGSSITLTGNGTAATVDPWVSSNTGIATVSSTGEVTGVSAGSTVITYTTDGGCSTDYTVTINIAPIHWNGSVSTDWNNSGNWSSAAVPTALDNVVIPSAPSNQPHVTLAPGTPAVCADLTIESGATLTVDAGKALTVIGDTDNEGTILVKADATGIGSLITEGTVTGAGSFQMEQYLTGSGGATPDGLFYYVSSPAVGATASSYAVASGNKLWSADETTQSYAQITDGSTVLNATEGYVARMGSTGAITFDGSSFNTGNQSASGLTRTGTTELNRGYNLVGNPYPSTVSWDAATKTNLEPSMYYRTHQGSSMLYDTYNAVGSIGTNNNLGGAVTGAIPPTQAFWVRVDFDGNTGQLDFANAMRSHGTLSGIYRMAAEEGTVRIALSNGTNSDEEIIFFDPSAQDGYDAYDSQKFWAGASVPQIYTSIGIDSLVINGLSSIATNPTVDLGVKLPAAGEYTFDATSITLNENVHLEDRYLGIFQDLNTEPTYAFTSSVAGNIPTRFALHFGMAVTGIEDGQVMKSRVYTSNGNQLNIILSENIENGNVQVLDMVGRIVRSANLNASRTTLDMNTATGVYLIRVETEKGTDTHRIVIN
jgi:hypothetical protein